MICKAEKEDVKGVYELICDMEQSALPYEEFERIFLAQLEDGNYCCLVCRREGELVAVLNLRFEEQLHLARELNLPVIIHDRDAHGDTLDLLRRLRPAGVVHCFSGSAQMAREVVELGMYVGFTGVVTFKNARRALEAAAQVPLDRLLIETDCPYMAPEPHRGRRCDSRLLPYTAQALAQVKGIPVQELLNHTCENARRLFALD